VRDEVSPLISNTAELLGSSAVACGMMVKECSHVTLLVVGVWVPRTCPEDKVHSILDCDLLPKTIHLSLHVRGDAGGGENKYI
jgi:hypothetical protein